MMQWEDASAQQDTNQSDDDGGNIGRLINAMTGLGKKPNI